MNIYRWTQEKGYNATWKETLEVICKYYSRVERLWYSNEFWAKTLKELPSLSEEQCHQKIVEIKRDEDFSLRCWEAYQ